MKKYLLLLAIPFTAFAQSSYELYPSKECEALKADYTAQINAIKNLNGAQRVNLEGLSQQLILIRSFGESVTNMENQAPASDFGAQSISAAYATIGYANASLENVSTMLDNNSTNTYRLGQLLTSVQNIDCGKCGSDSTNCCDFTQIEQVLEDIYAINIYHFDVTEEIRDTLFKLKPIIEVGFGSVTNTMNQGFYDITNLVHGLSTNLVMKSVNFSSILSSEKNTYLMTGNNLSPLLRDWSTYARTSSAFNVRQYGLLSAMYSMDFIHFLELSSLNNYFYDFSIRAMPIVTNTLSSLHSDQTNFFSFFRGEIGVRGVLEDWQSEQVSGTYHDFLTNHYLTVVRGGPLSGNQSSKTNWFSRIETLLAALVFTDSAETNTVDASAGNAERQQLSTSYGTANQAAATFSEDFKTTSQSIMTLYQNYFTTFENAAMPSHVVLMRLSNSDSSDEIEISFQSDSLGVLVEACRVITTFCWSSVGIFLLYKFLVWSARCVIAACQFIYRAISSVFKS